MASFSFNCPQCGKVYDKVRSNMAGRKVSCTCGKVFRLGPKTDQQMEKDDARRARKKSAREKTSRRTDEGNPPSRSADSDTPVHPAAPEPFEVTPIDATPIGKANRVFEAFPVEDLLPIPSVDKDPLVRVLPDELFDGPLVASQGLGAAAQAKRRTPAMLAKKPKGNQKHAKQKIVNVVVDQPIGGAIWTICFAFPAAIIQYFVASFFMSVSTRNDSQGVVLVSKLIGLVGMVFTLMILVAAVFAVVEVIKRQRMCMPIKVAGIGGVVMIVANGLFCSVSLLGLATRGVDAGKVAFLFFSFVVISLVPLTVAITGFVRNQPS